MEKEIQLRERKIIAITLSLFISFFACFCLASNFVGAASSSTDTYFSMVVPEWHCIELNGVKHWSYNGVYTPSLTECHKTGGKPTENCCPAGFDCINGNCTAGVQNCADYKSASACGNYNQNTAIRNVESVKWAGFCSSSWINWSESPPKEYTIVDCKCLWASSNCTFSWNQTSRVVTQSNPGDNDGICIYNIGEDSGCVGNSRHISWTTTWTTAAKPRPSYCEATGAITYSCIAGVLLSFFSWASLILAVIIIAIFYLIVIKKKKKFR